MYAAHLYILKAISLTSGRRSQQRELSRELTEAERLFEEPVMSPRRSAITRMKNRLNHLMRVALGTKPAGYRKTHQLYRCSLT